MFFGARCYNKIEVVVRHTLKDAGGEINALT